MFCRRTPTENVTGSWGGLLFPGMGDDRYLPYLSGYTPTNYTKFNSLSDYTPINYIKNEGE